MMIRSSASASSDNPSTSDQYPDDTDERCQIAKEANSHKH